MAFALEGMRDSVTRLSPKGTPRSAHHIEREYYPSRSRTAFAEKRAQRAAFREPRYIHESIKVAQPKGKGLMKPMQNNENGSFEGIPRKMIVQTKEPEGTKNLWVAVYFLWSLVLIMGSIIATLYLYKPPKTDSSRPLHFTISILSPFSSVIEQETSVIGTKLITVFLFFTSIVVYGIIRLKVMR